LKAIIVAAGPGSRLSPYTDDKPKCLLDVGGRTILQRAIDALRQNGIEEIAVVRGYLGDLINYPDIKYYENPDYNNTNLLDSLFRAESEMDGEFIVSYADILYGGDVVAKLVSSSEDITLIVDVGWSPRYRGRDQHPVAEAELVRVENGRVVAIGKGVVEQEEAYGEFIGLARFSRSGAEAMKSVYNTAQHERPDAPFQRASSLKTAYLNDMLQELVDSGHMVATVDIEGGWIEIDTPQDLEEARRRFQGN
jgi:choline kinase